jgi:hypothetical protein
MAAWPLARGYGGLLPTCARDEVELTVWQRAFLDAALAAGYPARGGLERRCAARRGRAVLGEHRRWAPCQQRVRFLDPMRERANLGVVDRVLADPLVLEHGRAGRVGLPVGRRAVGVDGRVVCTRSRYLWFARDPAALGHRADCEPSRSASRSRSTRPLWAPACTTIPG